MFPMACHRTLIGLVCGQLTLIGYTVMREGFYQALTMFPLPLISIKMMTVFKNMYVIPGACVSIYFLTNRLLCIDLVSLVYPNVFLFLSKDKR
jgi:hypothetical protein